MLPTLHSAVEFDISIGANLEGIGVGRLEGNDFSDESVSPTRQYTNSVAKIVANAKAGNLCFDGPMRCIFHVWAIWLASLIKILCVWAPFG